MSCKRGTPVSWPRSGCAGAGGPSTPLPPPAGPLLSLPYLAFARALPSPQARYGALAVAKDVGETEAVEVRRQMEEDVDREVEELKAR